MLNRPHTEANWEETWWWVAASTLCHRIPMTIWWWPGTGSQGLSFGRCTAWFTGRSKFPSSIRTSGVAPRSSWMGLKTAGPGCRSGSCTHKCLYYVRIYQYESTPPTDNTTTVERKVCVFYCTYCYRCPGFASTTRESTSAWCGQGTGLTSRALSYPSLVKNTSWHMAFVPIRQLCKKNEAAQGQGLDCSSGAELARTRCIQIYSVAQKKHISSN